MLLPTPASVALTLGCALPPPPRGGVAAAVADSKAASLSDRKAALVAGLKREYSSFFNPMEMELYDPQVTFDDPMISFTGADKFKANVDMLSGGSAVGKLLFSDCGLVMHSCTEDGERALTTRWTLQFRFKLLPWKPLAQFTGVSQYTLDGEATASAACLSLPPLSPSLSPRCCPPLRHPPDAAASLAAASVARLRAARLLGQRQPAAGRWLCAQEQAGGLRRPAEPAGARPPSPPPPSPPPPAPTLRPTASALCSLAGARRRQRAAGERASAAPPPSRGRFSGAFSDPFRRRASESCRSRCSAGRATTRCGGTRSSTARRSSTSGGWTGWACSARTPTAPTRRAPS